MRLEDIDIIHQTANEHIYTFDQNVADAVVGFESAKSQLLRKGARVIFDSTDIPGEIVDVVIVRPEFLQQRPENVAKLLQGWFKAIEFLRNAANDAAVKMSVRMQMKPQQVLDALAGIRLLNMLDAGTG